MNRHEKADDSHNTHSRQSPNPRCLVKDFQHLVLRNRPPLRFRNVLFRQHTLMRRFHDLP
jgi:hypothetical protein